MIKESWTANERGEWNYSSGRATDYWGLASGVGVPKGNGNPWCFGTATDIHDLRAIQESLRETEESFHTLADNISQFAWMTERDGAIFWFNRRWFEYTGTCLGQVRGWGWLAVLRPDDVDRVTTKLKDCVARGEPWEDVFPLRGADGSYRWFLMRAQPIRDAAGTVVRWFGTNTDVTAQRELEHALKDADRRKDEILATLAHELRNPLATVGHSLEIMKRAPGDLVLVANARATMERQLANMMRLIDDLLDVSRISRGKLELRRERVELSSIIQNAIETVHPTIDAMGHHLTVALPSQALHLDADPVRLGQVFANLISNACKYTERGGHISVTAVREGPAVAVSVTDSGVGISASDLPQLFTMFSQVEPVLDRNRGGLGIGLALVRGLVEMHGGKVTAHSEGRRQGSEFVVRLPLADDLQETKELETGRGEVRKGTGGRRILVVDDNEDSADSLRILLRQTGYVVETAYDGVQGIQLAEGFRPHIVLLDIGMPGVSGYDVCQSIRAQPWGKDMVLVAQTGYAQEDEMLRAAGAGFDAHLVKPVDVDKLIQLLPSLPAKDSREQAG